METMSTQISSVPLLSSNELSFAADYLASTRDSLLQTLSGLSDSQWHFKPAPENWSIAENVEHLVLIEDRIHVLLDHMQEAPPAELDRTNSQLEEIIVTEVPKRTSRFQAPPHLIPSHRWSISELPALFFKERARTLELLAEARCLRGHVMPHPIFGAWDGYQWILATAAHCARHTDQIREVKNCSGFPQLH